MPEKSRESIDCVVCGEYNYPTDEYSCAPCPYAAGSCNKDEDLTCKTDLGYTLNAQGRCSCNTGVLFENRCICQSENTYPEGDGEVTGYTGDCENCITAFKHIAFCSNFKCPAKMYDDHEKCSPCHYSCGTCSGPLDTDCLTCESTFEFVDVVGYDAHICLCECNKIENSEQCVLVDGLNTDGGNSNDDFNPCFPQLNL